MFRQKLSSVAGEFEVIDAGQDRFSSPGRRPGKDLQPDTFCFGCYLRSTTGHLDQVSFNYNASLVVNRRQ
jgi:hypothetical protein